MDIKKATALIGFAIKSGKVIYGLDSVVKSSHIKLVVYDFTLSSSSQDKLKNYCQKKSLICIKLESERLEYIVFKANCKLIGIVDRDFASAISAFLQNN
ncbi:MAG: hypothetical protein LBU60_04985 [Clostridiales bacterium]|jgi:ribosomal protein L30E|nr:hypothetical protein [Clostridiales bacterium]